MRRALTIVLLLALMAGFGFGVNRLIASRKSKIPTEATVFSPSATRPKIVLPGTLYLAQNGDIYRLSDGFFTDLHLTSKSGVWMQPAYILGSQNIIAVLRSAEYSNMYLVTNRGHVVRRLSNNATTHGGVSLNHWMFYPHVGSNGNTIYYSYDEPKNSSTLAVDFSVWSGALNGKLAGTQLSVSNPFTGGDVDPTPMAGGKVIDHMRPAKWFFHNHESEPTTEVAIRRGPAEDLYITLGNYDLAEGNATFKLVVNPVVDWIWFGFMLLAIGTGICLMPDAVLERITAGVPVGPARQAGAAGIRPMAGA